MGTSVSMRSPRTSRPWGMARASISAGAPPETVLTDVVRAAAGDWLSMLTSDGVTVYAQYAADAWARVADKPTEDDRRAEVSAVLRDARTRALSAGGAGVAVGLAERALARTLMGQLQDDADAAGRGQQPHTLPPPNLIPGLLGELMRQTAMHFFTRDAAAYTGTAAIPDVQTFNTATRRIGEAAANAARAGRPALSGQGTDGWVAAVRAAMQSAARPNANPGM